jgi:uncharacterized protein YbjT (DUF2867 family)
MNSADMNRALTRKILVSGASGYIGSRLVEQLLIKNPNIKVMVRDKRKILNFTWNGKVKICIADAKDYETTKAALEGAHTAFYLLHSMKMGSNFAILEAANARNFARAAEDAGVKQIVYLGGIANDSHLSMHMRSRVNTGRLLSAGSVKVLQIRAGIIIGSDSASFEMLKQLTHEFPFITTPRWIKNRTEPIAIIDVLHYLTHAAELKQPVNGIFDIGGPEVLTYSELIQRFAKISGLRRRWVIKLPFPSPAVAALLIGAFTRIPTALAKPLIGSLISEVVADPRKSFNGLIDPPQQGLMTLDAAIQLALSGR